MVLQNVMPYSLVDGINVSQEPDVSFFRVELWGALFVNVEVAGSFEMSVRNY
jgi:hypothetical protein